MYVRSGCLFHFTRSFAALSSILENGLWPFYVEEDVAWHGDGANQRLAFPMVCFCDIPLQRTRSHRHSYGDYAIGVSRDWAASKGASPVIYVANGSLVEDTLAKIRHTSSTSEGARVSGLLARAKQDGTPISSEAFGAGPDLDETRRLHMFCKRVEFIRESEWRFVPPEVWDPGSNLAPFLTHEFHNGMQSMNTLLRERAALEIPPSELKYVLVKNESEVTHPTMRKRVPAQCPVLSFERIEEDF